MVLCMSLILCLALFFIFCKCFVLGSGKTTLFRLLLGLEDIRASDANTGSIYVHGRDFTATNRVPLFSVVGQDNDLFRGLDLMQNIV